MYTRTRLLAISVLLVALSGSNLPAAGSAAAVSPSSDAQAEKDLVVRPNLTAAEIADAQQRASQLSRKMTVDQVEEIMGLLNVGGNRASLQDTLNAIPRRADIKVSATDGILRFDFVSDEKGRFRLTAWALLSGAKPGP